MNRYVIRDLMDYGDDFMLLKIRVFFAYFGLMEVKSAYKSTKHLGFFRQWGSEPEKHMCPAFACYYVNYELLSMTINQHRYSFDLNYPFRVACYRGHLDIVKLLIDKGADDLNQGLIKACQGGAPAELIEFLMEIGEYYQGETIHPTLDQALYGACLGRQRKTVDLLIEKGVCSWNAGLHGACLRQHQELIELMIEKGADQCWNCQKTISGHLSGK